MRISWYQGLLVPRASSLRHFKIQKYKNMTKLIDLLRLLLNISKFMDILRVLYVYSSPNCLQIVSGPAGARTLIGILPLNKYLLE